MKKFVALHFLPGAAGNFLSRCINLLDNTYVWSNSEKLPETLDEKYKVLTYKNAETPSWLEFELKIRPYYDYRPHWDIDSDGIAVFLCHPVDITFINERVGINDTSANIYIDCENNLDWCILNGWNKQSFQTISWFMAGELLEINPTVHKIKLEEMVNGYERFLPEFIKLAEFLGRPVTKNIQDVLHTLYNEWFKTTLNGPGLENQRTYVSKIFKKISNDFERKRNDKIA